MAMVDIPLLKRINYGYLGYLYWFTHNTTTHRLLGIRMSTLFKTLAIGLVWSTWLFNWGSISLILSLILAVWIFLTYWSARRTGYYRFVPGPAAKYDLDHLDHYEALAPYKRIACIATGVFSVQEWEKNVLFRPAAYWQVPRGEHAVMVEHEPQKYLYQFFNVAKIDEVQRGWLLYGRRPKPALAVSFESIWGPEFSQVRFSIFGSELRAIKPKDRRIYLTFSSEEAEQTICRNVADDLLRYRHEESD